VECREVEWKLRTFLVTTVLVVILEAQYRVTAAEEVERCRYVQRLS
jgi:hypothetical protein